MVCALDPACMFCCFVVVYTAPAIVQFFFIFTVPSGAPRRLSVADIGPRYIHLSWTEPKSSKQNGIIRHYQIYVTTLNSSTSTIIYVTPSSSPVYNLTALHPYTSYEITVAAFTISAGPKSIAVLAHTEEDSECVV